MRPNHVNFVEYLLHEGLVFSVLEAIARPHSKPPTGTHIAIACRTTSVHDNTKVATAMEGAQQLGLITQVGPRSSNWWRRRWELTAEGRAAFEVAETLRAVRDA